MTNHWVDIKNTDLVLIMGGNAAEAHPCGFKWVTEAKAHNGAKLIVVDPRFTRSAAVADVYAPIRAGTDIAFLGGVINYLLANDKIQREYVTSYTDFSVHREGGVRVHGRHLLRLRRGEAQVRPVVLGLRDGRGRLRQDRSHAQHPRCVYNLLKQHYARYTPEMVERICGTPKDKFLKVCEMIGSTASPTRAMTIMYALGWTQHSKGAQNIRCGAMVQLLLGNIGIAGGGMNALRGHSNIQGLTDLGLMSNLLPGYMTPAEGSRAGLPAVHGHAPPSRCAPNQMSYWQNYPKFFVSFLKARWGDAATAENNFAFDYLPKLDKLLRHAAGLRADGPGQGERLRRQGFNPLASAPNRAKMTSALSKLKFLVVMDPLVTETSEFWRNYGAFNDVDPGKIQTEVFRLPTTCFAEEDGSLVNSGRWLQWHWKGGEPPGEALTRHRDHGAPVPAAARPVQGRGRRLPRPDRQPGLALRPARRSRRPRNSPRSTTARRWRTSWTRRIRPRSCARRASRSRASPSCATTAARPAAAGSTPAPGGRGQHHGAARQLRPDGHRPDPELGLGLAGQPPHALQPRFVRCRRASHSIRRAS